MTDQTHAEKARSFRRIENCFNYLAAVALLLFVGALVVWTVNGDLDWARRSLGPLILFVGFDYIAYTAKGMADKAEFAARVKGESER